MEYFITFQYYDKKRRRLVAAARVLSENILEVFILTCSPLDTFRKKLGRQVYEYYLTNNCDRSKAFEISPGEVYNPDFWEVEIIDNNPRKTFFTFLKQNFKRKIHNYFTVNNSTIFKYPELWVDDDKDLIISTD